ncbi:MAG: bifunctional 4-hydroxy-2-oxoglutarate aldolase/2-dehydro-3-deoxy-phosphogluconate aldolase [Phycisphaeraceae bacterium]|nr:bifunctional 4-hydroxy-2-oxoglutarate aldolase/2-dehydro-3-deoxy-phosphogluconate aldolase [Phycisphaeraceae bacterium]MCW5754268.1 bifunctional 4-hydroxy-2-oxoglutarate aldolase/2-dehydro-3-deoxy-phosphogluconate aldolase [Phycisphaeraceae bacterium]
MTPDEFVIAFRERRASAILRTDSKSAAAQAMEAAIRGGFTICEFTLTTPGALDLISSFAGRPGLIVGSGTVLTALDAREAVAAGAQYLVSPVIDPAVIAEARNLGVAMMPGCATPTEMLTAHRAGAQLQKLFPAPVGPGWVAQTLAPLPFLRIVPTSGVTAENAAAYLAAGSHAVGFVNSLFDPADIAAGRYEVIEARARMMLRSIENNVR